VVGGGLGSASVAGGPVGIVVWGPVEIVVSGGEPPTDGPVVGTEMPVAEPVPGVVPAGLEGVAPVPPVALVLGAPAAVDVAEGSGAAPSAADVDDADRVASAAWTSASEETAPGPPAPIALCPSAPPHAAANPVRLTATAIARKRM